MDSSDAWALQLQQVMHDLVALLGLFGCLTLSLIGGNESGKPLPDTYTYEQFIEYKRKHGAEATRRKMKEIEAQRAEKTRKAKQQRNRSHAPPAKLKPVDEVTKKETRDKDKEKGLLGLSSRVKRKISGKPGHKDGKDLGYETLANIAANANANDCDNYAHVHNHVNIAPGANAAPGKTPDNTKGQYVTLTSLASSGSKTGSGSGSMDTSAKSGREKKNVMPVSKMDDSSRETQKPIMEFLKPVPLSPNKGAASNPGKQDSGKNEEFAPTVFEKVNAPIRPANDKLHANKHFWGSIKPPKKVEKLDKTTKEKAPKVDEKTEYLPAKREVKTPMAPADLKKAAPEDPRGDLSLCTRAVEEAPVTVEEELYRIKNVLRRHHKKIVEMYARAEKRKLSSKMDPSSSSLMASKQSLLTPAVAVSVVKRKPPVKKTMRRVRKIAVDEDEDAIVKEDFPVRGKYLRKAISARRHVDRPVDRLKLLSSTRPFGRRCKNPRFAQAKMKVLTDQNTRKIKSK